MATQAAGATRQQLDELDALLQKMLGPPSAVEPPVVRPEPRPPVSSPPSPPVAFGLPPGAAFDASSATPVAPPSPPAAVPSNWSIDLNPRDGSSVLRGQKPQAVTRPEPPAPPSMLSVTPIPPPTVTPQPFTSAGTVTVECEHVPLLLRPLACFSDGCDAMLHAFGPIGRAFTTPSGRTFVGYVGLAMLAASGLSCAMAWAGWTW
jgi:hypothetical protein